MVRRWFSPRSMLWHLLVVIIVGGCSYAAWWQWHRAAGGNTLSYLYSIEWPAFAVMAVIGWWQLVTEKPEELAARKEERRLAALPKPVAYDTEVLRRELAAHPELVRAFPDVIKAFPELGLTGAPELAGAELTGTPELAGAAPGAAVVAADGASVVPVTSHDEEVTPAPSQELRSYNELLGALAARGKPKTWRNPRGQ